MGFRSLPAWANLLIFGAVGALSAWQLWRAYSGGVVSMRGGTYTRAEAPTRFWIAVAINGVVLFVMLLVVGLYLDRTYIRPDLDHYASLYPAQAQRQNVESRVILRCRVDQTYRLRDCNTAWEERPGYGFGDAALKIASRTTLPDKDRPKVTPGQIVNFPVAFKLPAGTASAPTGAAPPPNRPAPPSS